MACSLRSKRSASSCSKSAANAPERRYAARDRRARRGPREWSRDPARHVRSTRCRSSSRSSGPEPCPRSQATAVRACSTESASPTSLRSERMFHPSQAAEHQLADALACEVELGGDTCERSLLAVEPEPQLEDEPLTLRER